MAARNNLKVKSNQKGAKGYELVIDFFANIGLSREASMYLKMFREAPPWKFAVVLISQESLHQSASEVAMDLAYLTGLNLYPIIVLDNIQLTDGNIIPFEPANDEIRRKYSTGQLVRLHEKTNSALVDSIVSSGGSAVSIYDDLFDLRAPIPTDRKFDFRLLVDHIMPNSVKNAVRRKQIPVISPVVMDSSGQLTIINAEKVAKALCKRLKPQKFIVIHERGGILDRSGEIVRNLILSTDYENVIQSGTLDERGLRQLSAVRRLISEVPDLTVQVASPAQLLFELFTVKGRGSYIRSGHSIMSAENYDNLDKEAMRSLIEESFGRSLVEDYFEDKPHRVFYERSYHGAIIVKELDGDIFYLDKFVIGPRWQGEGMGGPLWRELSKYYQKLVWRASPENPINRWYAEQADGYQKTDNWNIYWIGTGVKEVAGIIEKVCEKRKTVI